MHICGFFSFIGILDTFVLDERLFYHRFKTSSELCSAGLFSYESESASKKHKKLKCKFVFFMTNM